MDSELGAKLLPARIRHAHVPLRTKYPLGEGLDGVHERIAGTSATALRGSGEDIAKMVGYWSALILEGRFRWDASQ